MEQGGIQVTTMSAEAPSLAQAFAPLEVGGASARRARRPFAQTCLRADAVALAAAAGASMVGAAGGGLAFALDGWAVLFAVLALALFHARGLYRPRLSLAVLDDLRAVAGATTAAAMTVLSLRLLLHSSPALAVETLRPWAFAVAYACCGRLALYRAEAKARAAGEALRPALVVGAGPAAERLVERLEQGPELGLGVVCTLDPTRDADELEALLDAHGIEHVVVACGEGEEERLLALANRAESLGAGVTLVPRLHEKVPARLTVEHVGAIALLTPHATDPKGWQFALKYAFDRVVAAVLVLLASPVLLACAAAVWLTMGRPVFFRQTRIGRDGVPFGILKLRTMKLPTAEELELQARAIAHGLPGGVEGADRRTRVGTLLRKTSLDELPQLLNVLLGEMSLVGPRPERPEFAGRFEGTVRRYGERHRVKAGITGWAQVHGLRGKTSIEDRAEWDNWYVENFSGWLDLKILVRTAAAVVRAFRDVE